MTTKNLIAGKKGVIMGVANKNSIAWGIAQACHEAGGDCALTYQGDILKKRVEPLGASINSKLILPCDVTNQASIDKMFDTLKQAWGEIDFLVHAIAFADRQDLEGRYIDTSPEGFAMALQVSCYSFTALARRAEKLMPQGGSLLTLTYYGAEKVIPHYNVMGVAKSALEASTRYLAADLGEHNIRVNAISAGPIRTLAAAGIRDFRDMLKYGEKNTPMRRNITKEEVGQAALYLLSDMSAGVTGEIHYVDNGYNITGMPQLSNIPDIQT